MTAPSPMATPDTASAPAESPRTHDRLLSLLSLEEQGSDAPAPAPKATPDDYTPTGNDVPEGDDEPSDDTPQDEPTDEEQPDEQPEPEPLRFRVKINGREEEVTQDELVAGYSRQADYTRKTQTLAEERKHFEGERMQVQSERQRYVALLDKMEAALAEQAPTNIDWDRLRQENPTEFATKYAEHQYRQEQLRIVQVERDAAQRKMQEDHMRAMGQHVERERERLLDAVPEWRDAKTADTDKRAMLEYAQSLGFSEHDVNAIADHRAVVLLRKAMLFDRQQATRKAVERKVAKATPTVTPNAPNSTPRKAVTELTRAKQSHAKLKNVKSAEAAFYHLIDAEEKLSSR